MRIPRKNGEAVIVLGGRSGAFWFGFWAMLGVLTASLWAVGVWRITGHALKWLSAWWGA